MYNGNDFVPVEEKLVKNDKKWRIVTIFAFVLAWTLGALTHPRAQEKLPISKMTWQYSAENVVKIGVRNKYGWLDSYKVTFIIQQPNHKEITAGKVASRDESIYVYFPDDFETFTKPGKYGWRAVVEGHVIGKGMFEYTAKMGIK